MDFSRFYAGLWDFRVKERAASLQTDFVGAVWSLRDDEQAKRQFSRDFTRSRTFKSRT